MIPWTLIIAGVLFTLGGALVLLLLLFLPVYERFEVVFDKDKEVVQSRTDRDFMRVVQREKKRLTRDSISSVFAGILMFFAGLYLGFAAKGAGFWPYKMLFPDKAVTAQVWDKINADGQFVDTDGKAYTYYILVSGQEVSLSGEPCADLADLKQRLTEVKRENTVIIYDSFAVSSCYRGVVKILDELGMTYEETK